MKSAPVAVTMNVPYKQPKDAYGKMKTKSSPLADEEKDQEPPPKKPKVLLQQQEDPLLYNDQQDMIIDAAQLLHSCFEGFRKEFIRDFLKLAPNHLDHLSKPFTRMEIEIVLFQMNGSKAPGPDGMPPIFFQQFWDMVVNHLGKYLGGFIEGPNPDKQNYALIMTYLQQRLTGWKSSMLSQAARYTLIQSVLESIPIYLMHFTVLTDKEARSCDSIINNFFWGELG
ncbi:reverse transcriptase [Senna tora]|uniref:Reverse transcriptase n=1 Tax=Senna tora TaxID=362788 RepID=A0A835CJF2_9FABA|nr:reverse transcriptase [Senna tora]